MKRSITAWSLCLALVAGTVAQAAPKPAKPAPVDEIRVSTAVDEDGSFLGTKMPANKIPAEVRAVSASGVTTIALVRFPTGPQGTPILLHSWMISRGTTGYAVCCVDIFYREKEWELAYTTYNTDYDDLRDMYEDLPPGKEPLHPITYTARWLHPATKQGVVIVEDTYAGGGTAYRLITLPEGVAAPFRASDSPKPFVQEFSAGGEGAIGGISFGVDAKGGMTVEKYGVHKSAAARDKTYDWRETYAWREERWSKVATKRSNVK